MNAVPRTSAVHGTSAGHAVVHRLVDLPAFDRIDADGVAGVVVTAPVPSSPTDSTTAKRAARMHGESRALDHLRVWVDHGTLHVAMRPGRLDSRHPIVLEVDAAHLRGIVARGQASVDVRTGVKFLAGSRIATRDQASLALHVAAFSDAVIDARGQSDIDATGVVLQRPDVSARDQSSVRLSRPATTWRRHVQDQADIALAEG